MTDVHACRAPQDLHSLPAVVRHGCVRTSPFHTEQRAGMPLHGRLSDLTRPSNNAKDLTRTLVDSPVTLPAVQFPHSHIASDVRA